MNKYHQQILEEIKKKTRQSKSFYLSSNYSGSLHPRYGLSVPGLCKPTKKWKRNKTKIKKSYQLIWLKAILKSLSLVKPTGIEYC